MLEISTSCPWMGEMLLLHFFNHSPQYGRVRHNVFFGFRRPEHIGFDDNFFTANLLRKKLEGPIDCFSAAVVRCRVNHDAVHIPSISYRGVRSFGRLNVADISGIFP